MSDQIWFQRVIGARDGFEGFWMCPTPNCGGAGFTFDIFPTDPNHPANAGWFDDDECEEDFDPDAFDQAIADGSNNEEYDPNETKWKRLDEEIGDDADDDDIEGEEWKHGLTPGERLSTSSWSDDNGREWDEEQKKYDMPDERPRQVDWSDREDQGSTMRDDDIPF